VHAFRLVGELLRLEKSALAERFLLAGICKVMAMATREQAATGIKLGHLPTTEYAV
jgi:hypothetical protein